MRGKENSGGCKRCCIRITPAYAGKSLPKSWRNMTQKGSPPPMRGKEYRRYLRRNERGITPAYAGKRAVSGISLALTWDHPRLCGEKPVPFLWHNLLCRITPAYAGKRGQYVCCRRGEWDHPRLCGEKAVRSGYFVQRVGSPPPMRGKVRSWHTPEPCCGITPAYAGKRSST